GVESGDEDGVMVGAVGHGSPPAVRCRVYRRDAYSVRAGCDGLGWPGELPPQAIGFPGHPAPVPGSRGGAYRKIRPTRAACSGVIFGAREMISSMAASVR